MHAVVSIQWALLQAFLLVANVFLAYLATARENKRDPIELGYSISYGEVLAAPTTMLPIL